MLNKHVCWRCAADRSIRGRNSTWGMQALGIEPRSGDLAFLLRLAAVQAGCTYRLHAPAHHASSCCQPPASSSGATNSMATSLPSSVARSAARRRPQNVAGARPRSTAVNFQPRCSRQSLQEAMVQAYPGNQLCSAEVPGGGR